MKKTLTLSLVIPAYNEEEQIAACLESVAAQTVMPSEVIVVDNNSIDNTVRIAKGFPFVKLVRETRQGLRYTRNTGIAVSIGDIIGRIDADTRLTPDWVENALRIFADPSVMAATGPCYYHDMPAKNVGLLFDNAIRRGLFKIDESPVLFGSNMLLRASAWQAILPSLCDKGEFFEDLDITIHMREHRHTIIYDQGLIIGVSSRRLEDDPVTFYQNMRLHKKTFEMHGQQSPVATAGKYIYMSIYPPLKVLRRAYDPQKQRLSLTRMVQPGMPRPTANT